MEIVKNDLLDYDLMIYQNRSYFKFSLDSVLLAEYIKLEKDHKLVDFCCGNAPILLILSTKYKNKLFGIEIQDEIFNLAQRSIQENKLEKQIELVKGDIKNINTYLKAESIDVVSCNPPFFKINEGSNLNINDVKAIARHELKADLNEILKSAAYILKNKGFFYMIHRSERLQEILSLMTSYKLFVKEVVIINTTKEKSANIVLIKAIKNGNFGLKIRELCIQGKVSYKNIFD